jgi:D-alanine-D-alanine ligase
MSKKRLDVNVVFIADIGNPQKELSVERTDLEFAEPEYFEEMRDALSVVSDKVFAYNSPREFLNNIAQHRDDIVFSIWSGQCSRNRKALVPSICEAYGIAYVGADAYTQILCQDKALSKGFACRYGFATPPHRLISNERQIGLVHDLSLPLVIKPNFEGGSIGITQKNLVYEYKTAANVASELLSVFRQPILAEEFISGRESSIVIVGHGRNLGMVKLVEHTLDSDEIDLDTSLYSMELKKGGDSPAVKYAIKPVIPDNLHKSALDLFKALDKVEVLRIDGRLREGSFHLIELSPDVHFGSESTVAAALRHDGLNYEQMIFNIILNALQGQAGRFQSANMR